MIVLEGDQQDMMPLTDDHEASVQRVEELVSSVQRMSEQRLSARKNSTKSEDSQNPEYESQLTVLFQVLISYLCMSSSIADIEAGVQSAIDANKDPLVVLLHKIAEARQLSIAVAEEGSLEITAKQLVLSLGLLESSSTVFKMQNELVGGLTSDVKQAFAALHM